MDLLTWTDNRALIATGSPFGGSVAQCNNAFSFPGIGLGLIASKAQRLTDNMLWMACETLSQCAPVGPNEPLLPPLGEARYVAYKIAVAIVNEARKEGIADIPNLISAEEIVTQTIWEPFYRDILPMQKKDDS